MHIVHLYKDYAPVVGGIEGHLQTLTEGLVARGFRVSVVVCQPKGMLLAPDEILHGVRIIRVPRHIDFASNAWSFALVNTVRMLEPDLLHLQMPWPAGDLVVLMLRNIPCVVSYQSDVVRQRGLLQLYAPLLRWTLNHARAVCVSSAQYALSSQWLRDAAERVHVIPLGIADPLANVSEKMSTPRHPYILWVGRMRYYKGLDTAIRAMAHVDTPLFLVLVGSGPMEESLRALATSIGVANRICWMGNLDEEQLAVVRAKATCFVFPSQLRSEAYGLALLEAIAAGIPAISCEIGTATSVLNEHDKTGIVIAPNDHAACALAINTICADPVLRSRYSIQARAHYLRDYTTDKMIDRVSALYRSVMQNI